MSPGRKPRIAITLSDEATHLVAEIAELTGSTKTSIVSELLDVALPAMQTMLEALRIVKEQPKEAERLLARHANAAALSVAQAQLEFHEHIDGRTVRARRKKRGQKT